MVAVNLRKTSSGTQAGPVIVESMPLDMEIDVMDSDSDIDMLDFTAGFDDDESDIVVCDEEVVEEQSPESRILGDSATASSTRTYT